MRFCDIVGHDHAKETLRRAADRNRVPHACLFHGPEGVGKKSLALAFLQYLVCRDRTPGDPDSCGECRPCRQVAAGTFADLLVMEPEKGVIKIERIREAFPRLQFEPLVGPWKCILINDAHALTIEAANAALKTLEEPPSNTLFVLVTSTPDTLPRTVLSRCLHLSFGPLPAEVVAGILVDRHGMSEVDARNAAALAQGSPAVALKLVGSPVLAERVGFLKSFLELADAGPEQRLRFAEGIAGGREEFEEHEHLVKSLMQDILAAVAGQSDDRFCNADLGNEIRAFARRIGPDRVLEMAAAFMEWDSNRRYHPNSRMFLDRLVLSF
jgi:DNA polymerase-3 subunit delta'